MNMNIEELLRNIHVNQVNNNCGSVTAVNINNYSGTAAAAPSTPQQPVATHFPADYQSRAFVSNVGGIAISLEAIRSMIAQLIVAKMITKKYHWAAVQLALEEMGLCSDNSSLLADELNSQYWFPELEEDIKPNNEMSRYVSFIKEHHDLENCKKIYRDKRPHEVTQPGLESVFAIVEHIKKTYSIDKFAR